MDSTRQQKVARLIQKDLGDIFQQQSKSWFEGAMLTVTAVRTTKDLSIARVYVSILPLNGISKDTIIKSVKAHSVDIRWELGIKTKNQLRIIPNLEFFVDDSLDYVENIEKLLKQ